MSSLIKHKKIIIIGGGIGGLAAAALLAKDGHKVTVLEKNEQLGGRASRLTAKGYTFDLGPSWYMMNDVFEKFFAEFGKKPTDYLKLIRVQPQYRIFFSDRTHLDITSNLKQTKKTFESIEKGSSAALDRYLSEAKLKYEVAIQHVLYHNADHLRDFFTPALAKYGAKLHPFTSMDHYVKRFFHTEKLQQIIQYTLVFLGGAPSNMPALYSLMSHVDFNLGTYYPMGGFYEVTKAIVAVGKKQGVTYLTDQEVSEIVTKNGVVTGVTVNGKHMAADVVISNADYAHTEDLLSDQSARSFSKKSWDNKVLSPSAFLLYIGYKGTLPQLQHHNIYFGKNWINHFNDIFDRPNWPKQPSVYINKPSATDHNIAPKGHENLMILVPIASRLKEDKTSRLAYAHFILQYLKKNIGVDLQSRLEYIKIFSVSDFATRYNSLGGNALGGLAHTLLQTGPWRSPNKSKKLSNLFFVGATTVPGIGVPPAIISAHLVRDRVRSMQ